MIYIQESSGKPEIIFNEGIPHTCPEECDTCRAKIPEPYSEPLIGEESNDALCITVDRCCIPDLQALWAAGARTVCCCCGHGDPDAAMIVVLPEDADKVRKMGYTETKPRNKQCAKCGASFRPKECAGHLDSSFTCRSMGRRCL